MSPELRSLQAQAAVNLITDLSRNDFDAAQSRYEDLRELTAGYIDEPELRYEQAKAAFNLIVGLGEK